MRIVKLAEFLKLPSGTVFAKWEPCIMDCLMVKGDNVGNSNDFYYVEIKDACGKYLNCYQQLLVPAESGSDSETIKQLEFMIAGERPEMNLSVDFTRFSRDAIYDDEQLFAVWSSKDLTVLRTQIEHAIIVTRAIEV